MKKNDPVVPKKIEELNKYQIIAAPYIKLNKLRLQVAANDITDLDKIINDPIDGWVVWHAKHADPNLKSEPGNASLVKCQKILTQKFQYIYRNIPRNVMITDDFITLNIAEPTDHRTKRGPIVSTPFGKTTPLGGGVLKYEVRTSAEAKTAKMDDLANVIRVMGVILKPGDDLPTDPSQCTVTFTSTKAIFKHTFPGQEVGNRFACYLQYVNTTDESKNGQRSELLICVIA